MNKLLLGLITLALTASDLSAADAAQLQQYVQSCLDSIQNQCAGNSIAPLCKISGRFLNQANISQQAIAAISGSNPTAAAMYYMSNARVAQTFLYALIAEINGSFYNYPFIVVHN